MRPTASQLQALSDLLARLVIDGELTEEQAVAIYLSYADDGTLLDELLPLPPYLGIDREPESDDDPPILLLILGAAAGVAIGRQIDAMSQRQRLYHADNLADAHAIQADALARDLSAGRMTVAEFQTALRTLNRTHAAGQVTLGAGSRAPLYRSTLEDLAERESAFLQRFADHVAGRGLAGSPMSAEAIAQRAAQYGGVGRAQFFRVVEQQQGGREGWVCKYKSRDDDRTCICEGEPVITETGEKPIEELRVGDYVLSGQGNYVRIAEIHSRTATRIREIRAGESTLRCTGDHPILIKRQARLQWEEAASITTQDAVLIHDSDKPAARGIALDRGLGNALDAEGLTDSPLDLDGITSLDAFGPMPVVAVDLDQQSERGQVEVKNIFPQSELLFVADAKRIEQPPRFFFNRTFLTTRRLAIARERAITTFPRLIVRRCNAKGLSAAFARFEDWRPAALFGAVRSRSPVGGVISKFLSAPATSSVNAIIVRFLAGDGADFIARRGGLRYREFLIALRTYLGYCRCRLSALWTTVRSFDLAAMDFVRLSRCGLELFPAMATGQDPRTYAPSLPFLESRTRRTEPRRLLFLGEFTGKNVNLTAPITSDRVCFHDQIIPRNVISCNVAENIRRKETATVYDLVLESDHTFFARKILVHNCSPCHEAAGYYLPGRGPYPGEICLGRHYCRCRRTTLYRPDIYARLMAGERVRSAA